MHQEAKASNLNYECMKKRYQAVVNDELQFDLTREDVLPFRNLNNVDIQASDQLTSIHAKLTHSEFFQKKYTLRINASIYEVQLKNDLDLLIEEMGFAAAKAGLTNELTAPMPGLIVNILTEPGAEVMEGQKLLVLEAMKMENTLTSPKSGIVKSILVKAGDTVDKGKILIEFDEENP